MKKIIAMLGAVVVATAQAEALNVITYYYNERDEVQEEEEQGDAEEIMKLRKEIYGKGA